VAPDYRKSVKHPFPAGFNDSYDTLLWMKENAEQLHLLPDQFIVAGHSAGGGLTAAIALKARDTKQVNIAFQMPIYPMIDHRQITPSSQNMKKAPIWDSNNTKIAWDYYLRDLRENNKAIPPYASPSLNDHYEGLPPTITFVGDLEPFRDETIAYVEALKMAGIPVKFKLFKRAFHSFEIAASNSQMAKEANRFLFDAFGEYYDKYIIFG
jgi:acetyl esterase/lipase